MKNEQEIFQNVELICRIFDGVADPEMLRAFESHLHQDPELLDIYAHVAEIYGHLVCPGTPSRLTQQSLMDEEEILSNELWQQLVEYEKTAPEIKIPQEQSKPGLIQKVVYAENEKRRVSKFNLVFLALNAAAVVFLVLFLHFAPSQEVKVATLTDSINAKWANIDYSMEKGSRLSTGHGELYLKEGLAKILFDNNAKVVIEGPAVFELLAEDRIRLNYGNIYSSVPPEAIGFSVFTKNAKIFDMGTEFGVEADFRGNTLLHVIKGSTMLVAGEQSGKKGIEVKIGGAKKISAVKSEISDISCDYDYFVRNIDSKTDLVWRGENLSLASIVAGFDGLQEVDSLISLDPLEGKYVISREDVYRKTNNTYNVTSELKYIDGVFVPDGESGPVQITSSGLTFDCPDTGGVFTHLISAYEGFIEKQHATIPPLIINGQEIIDEPILMLHSNIGITFDLQAIRNSSSCLNVKSFKATGVANKKYNPVFDFSILVDGQVKYERKIETDDSERGPIPFNVELRPEDRFLTLIITDGIDNSYVSDFLYLINPELCLTDKN